MAPSTPQPSCSDSESLLSLHCLKWSFISKMEFVSEAKLSGCRCWKGHATYAWQNVLRCWIYMRELKKHKEFVKNREFTTSIKGYLFCSIQQKRTLVWTTCLVISDLPINSSWGDGENRISSRISTLKGEQLGVRIVISTYFHRFGCTDWLKVDQGWTFVNTVVHTLQSTRWPWCTFLSDLFLKVGWSHREKHPGNVFWNVFRNVSVILTQAL